MEGITLLRPQKEGHASPRWPAAEIPDFTKFGKDLDPCVGHNRGHKNE